MHFKLLTKDHEALVKKWLQQDYVAEFWHGTGLESTYKSIASFIDGKETLFTLWIAYDNATPFGYLMTSKVDFSKDYLYAKYLTPTSKAITLDLLIGNTSYLGKGLGHQMIKELLLQKFSDVTDVFIDPGVNNPKAIHVYEKAGFQKLEEFIPEWDPSSPSLLMHLKMSSVVSVYTTKPSDFKASIQVAACYVEIDGDLLLLQCSPNKQEAGTWGVPAGKIEENESTMNGAKRELLEETGIDIPLSNLHPLTTLYIRKPKIDYSYHLFKVTMPAKPKIVLSSEHPAYMWASKKDLETLPLMVGAKEALETYRSFILS